MNLGLVRHVLDVEPIELDDDAPTEPSAPAPQRELSEVDSP